MTEPRELVRRRHAGRRVLLVDDNEVNREIATELLVATGLRVDAAEDGRFAVACVRRHAYELVLMDIVMPEMGGIEATTKIRALRGESMPIIAMTAHASAEDRLDCLAAGLNDHLTKPVDPNALYAILLRWLPLHASPVHDRVHGRRVRVDRRQLPGAAGAGNGPGRDCRTQRRLPRRKRTSPAFGAGRDVARAPQGFVSLQAACVDTELRALCPALGRRPKRAP